ncbi:hypothetical protein RF11_11798 [Thelohanellus kitauei]|uniref:Histone methyltransferase Tudor domain-containing protein n=1 Tax=Thelohanellus kitauei TaxID=669202 RepID=A0A0C2MIC2_THEKT|nr:hypothetical protein RF11_11798 [Thelohanellus kitauei]
MGIGTRVVARWPGISNYLPGNISSIDVKENSTKYLISFDDGDNHWNSLDQIRLLKPPMYFGPGSNNSYLEKKFSTIKTTTLVNSQIEQAIKCEKVKNNQVSLNSSLQDHADSKENVGYEYLITSHPRTSSTIVPTMDQARPMINSTSST